MSDLLIKNVPPELHSRLKQAAKQHRRSVTQQVLKMLEQSMEPVTARFPDPVRGKRPITQKMVSEAIKEGRA